MEGLPRIDYDELPQGLRDLLAPRVQRLGYLGEFFQTAAHQPEALEHFVGFTEALKRALPERLSELVALTVSTCVGNDYERVQHERLSLKLGLSETWVRDVERLAPESPGELAPLECAAQTLVLSLVQSLGREAAVPARRFLEQASPELLVGVLLATGRYLAHGAFCNAVGIAPPVDSPLAPVASAPGSAE